MIEINDLKSWPTEVKQYLADQSDFLKKYCSKETTYRESEILAPQYDRIIKNLKALLSPYHIHGYHCTRLTKYEIDKIYNEGMQLPDHLMLAKRIQQLVADKLIPDNISLQLISNNDANDEYRKGMLWFCFFAPSVAGEDGIGEFVNFWGGEALYHSHEHGSEAKEILRTIGIPSIVEASLPLYGFDLVELKFANKYKHFLGIEDHSEDYEGSIEVPLLPSHILDIISYPDPRFMELTSCHNWDSHLS